MGLEQSKKKPEMNDSVFVEEPEEQKIIKIGDENNLALLRFCINNQEAEILTALESGTDLASPYNGIPLIISATLALINDTDHERFKRNWETILKYFNTDVPILDDIDLRITNYTMDSVLLRSSSYPILHLGELRDNLLKTDFKNKKEYKAGILRKYNLKNTLLFVMTNIQSMLKDVTTNKSSNAYNAYEGTATQKMEKVINKNAKYVIDNINTIEKYWNKNLEYKEYYNKYNDEYTMDIPYAVPVNNSGTN